MSEFLEEKIESGRESETPRRRVFVEIGTNSLPIPLLGDKKFENGDIYIGIDISESKLRSARESSPEEKVGKNLFFISADAEKMPLKDGNVDELYFGNVFGYSAIPSENLEKFLDEAKRVLNKGGRLIIKENNTPADIEMVVNLLKKHGFMVKKLIKVEEEEWTKAIAPYDKYSFFSKEPPENSFLLEAERSVG